MASKQVYKGKRIIVKRKSYSAKVISKGYKQLLKPYGLKVPK